MKKVEQKAIELAKYLFQKEILDKDLSESFNGDIEDSFMEMKIALKNKFPNTKTKFKMKSIHYANRFQNEKLKNVAFILDDIEEILCFNGFSNHDKNVDFFNKTITQNNFEMSSESFVITAIDSLLQ